MQAQRLAEPVPKNGGGMSWIGRALFIASSLSWSRATPLGAADVESTSPPGVMFVAKCTSCHTFSDGDRVGPDLKGVTARRSRSWLTSWIRSSDRMIRSGDPTALLLFRKYKQQRMPDQAFSDAEIAALLDYLAGGGPQADAQKRLRLAASASRADVERGRDLFFGRRAWPGGDLACAACHSLQPQQALAGGSLGPDLTQAFSKYQDRALAALIERSCFPRTPKAQEARAKREGGADDSFALRAFLRETDLAGRRPLTRPQTAGARP